MGNDLIFKCCLCNNDFRPEGLNKEGKCVECAKLYPNVKTREEMLLLNRPEIHLGEKVDVEKVRQIIKEELNAFKAELRMEKARAAKNAVEAKAKIEDSNTEETK